MLFINPNTDAKGRGNNLANATHIIPTSTRDDMGAVFGV